MMGTSSDASGWGTTADYKDFAVNYIGVNIDAKFGTLAAWLTGISESGDADDATTGASHDISGTLIALGASMPVGPVSLKAEILNASGDSNAADNKEEAFWVPKGQSYYWAEIMGYGLFDNQLPAGSPGDQISNLIAYGIGASFKPMKNMKVSVDLWNASLAEAAAGTDDDLGTEIDLRLTYNFLEKLTLDVVAARLSAGDATGGGKEDPTEIGTRLAISF
jgi:phosphate-selective porin